VNAANLIQVYSAGDSIEAYALSNRLEDAGVRAMVVGDHLQGGLGALPFGRSTAPRLCVAAEDAQRAEEIVAAWESERQRPRGNRNALPFQFGLSAVLINMTLLARETSQMKTSQLGDPAKLESIPNVGPVIAAKLRLLGFASPSELAGRDPYEMFQDLCARAEKRYDPCLLDVFISAVSFADGEPPRPWWKFTKQRKAELARRAHRYSK
jgi:hypothetical protein